MNIKRKLLNVTIILFMVLSLSLSIGHTLAYWQGNVVGDSDTATATIDTGEWNQAFPWDPNETYLKDDRVTNNGFIYEAKRNNPEREPGVAKGWNRDWTEVGPA